MTWRNLLIVPAVVLCAAAARADDKNIDYTRQIKPLLARRCVTCHGPLKQSGDLRLDAAVLIHKGGESGPAVAPGKPAESLLFDAVTKAEFSVAMPKTGGALKEDEIELLRAWIAQGAAAPDDEQIAADPRQHWAYIAPQRPNVPEPENADWRAHPVDAFLAAEHELQGVVPQPPAPKHVLLRRVYLDLIGLPPSPEELHEFLADESPAAYEKVVDRLLDSPQYGERWGRHWMDVWRYSDWYGYQAELRNSAKHIWRWRDWIVESLNRDAPYDGMVRDMLAADELAPTDPDRLRATGFLARNYYKFNRDTWLDETIEHTGKAFLGVQLNCARCHDHMYDPIAQAEYYQFRAIFEPHRVRTDRIPGQPDVNSDGLPRVYDADLTTPTYIFERGNDKYPDKENPVGPAIPDVLAGVPFKVEPVALPVTAWFPGGQEFVQAETIAAAEAGIAQQKTALDKAREALEAANADDGGNAQADATAAIGIAEKELAAAEAELASARARIAADIARIADPPAENASELAAAAAKTEKAAALLKAAATVAAAEQELTLARRAADADEKQKPKLPAAEKKLEAANKQLAAAKTAAENPDEAYTRLSTLYPATSSGRRTALASWITHRDNPLAARVAVNHIWMRHFGTPLVSTVFDFGLNGRPPSHPQLLDWLAVELMENGWRMKHLHRLLVTSRAYRMHSSTGAAPEENLRVDPDNQLLWRMNSRRMESELVRDSVLAVSGQLDPTAGGPELDAGQGLTTFRRSLYYRHAPEKFMTFLKLFDSASATDCYRRNETVVPQQALALVNSQLSVEQARRLSAELTKQSGEPQADGADARFINALFTRVLCRPPTSEEQQTCRQFLTEQAARLADPQQLTKFTTGPQATTPPAADPHLRARENLTHVLLNHNEFITIR